MAFVSKNFLPTLLPDFHHDECKIVIIRLLRYPLFQLVQQPRVHLIHRQAGEANPCFLEPIPSELLIRGIQGFGKA